MPIRPLALSLLLKWNRRLPKQSKKAIFSRAVQKQLCFFLHKTTVTLLFTIEKNTRIDILMIPKAKGYKSDASILARGILNLRPAKNMSRKPENQQEKQQMSSRSFSCTCFCGQFSASRTRIPEADATPTPLKFGHN